jgi:hypothetical protein
VRWWQGWLYERRDRLGVSTSSPDSRCLGLGTSTHKGSDVDGKTCLCRNLGGDSDFEPNRSLNANMFDDAMSGASHGFAQEC